jgi:MFS family permease
MWALVLICVAQFVVVLDATIVTTALPAIRQALGFSDAGLQWVFTAYTLVFGGPPSRPVEAPVAGCSGG